jgi:hypothetical protein
MVYGGNMLSIKPVANHLRVIPDYTFWRGMFVMAGDQIDNAVGQPQSNFLFTNIDDLWKMGKPSGFGAVWLDEQLKAGQTSDPFLMNGFDKKVVHLTSEAKEPVQFTLEVDFDGRGKWVTYQTLTVPANGYVHHEFPNGFSVQWIRAKVNRPCKATVHFVYN